jgi:hypothetical protein
MEFVHILIFTTLCVLFLYLERRSNEDEERKKNPVIAYHGTRTKQSLVEILTKGFKVGKRATYGSGIYLTRDFWEASTSYSELPGGVIKVSIYRDTKVHIYEDLPGSSAEMKQLYAQRHSIKIVYIRKRDWFLIYGLPGTYVKVPGKIKFQPLNQLGHNMNLNQRRTA